MQKYWFFVSPDLHFLVFFQIQETDVDLDAEAVDLETEAVDLDDVAWSAAVIKNKGFFVWGKTWIQCMNRWVIFLIGPHIILRWRLSF